MPSVTPAEYVRLRLSQFGSTLPSHSTALFTQRAVQHERSIVEEYRKIVRERDPDMDYEDRLKILKELCDRFVEHPPLHTVEEPKPLLLFPRTPQTPMSFPLLLSPNMVPTSRSTYDHTSVVIKRESAYSTGGDVTHPESRNTAPLLPPLLSLPGSESDWELDSDDQKSVCSTDSGSNSDDSLSDRKMSSRDMLVEHAHKIRMIKREIKQLRKILHQSSSSSSSPSSIRHVQNVKRRGGATRYTKERRRVLIEAYNQQILNGQIDAEGRVITPGQEVLIQLSRSSGLTEMRLKKWFANRSYAQRKKQLRQEKRKQVMVVEVSG